MKSIVTLDCGCFFEGRDFHTDPACEDHREEDVCSSCGERHPIEALDAKPTMNSRLRRIQAREGQLQMLTRAADLGFDFDRIECSRCYGPGFQNLWY